MPWNRSYALEIENRKLTELCERRLRACISLERQKTVQYTHIQLLEKENASLRERMIA